MPGAVNLASYPRLVKLWAPKAEPVTALFLSLYNFQLHSKSLPRRPQVNVVLLHPQRCFFSKLVEITLGRHEGSNTEKQPTVGCPASLVLPLRLREHESRGDRKTVGVRGPWHLLRLFSVWNREAAPVKSQQSSHLNKSILHET